MRDPWTLQKRVVLVVDPAGQIAACCSEDEVPANVPMQCFPGEVWAAAPILAHAHLESFDAPSASWRRHGFTPWVEDLLAWRMTAERLSAAESAVQSLHELKQNGCGLVLSHVAERGAEGPPKRGLPEVLPLSEVFAPDEASFSPGIFEAGRKNGGLALHAPYSVTPKVAQQVFTAFQEQGLVSIHLGEHPEERAYLVDGSGPMAELLARRERPMVGGQWKSPVDWLHAMGGKREGVLAVHGGDLQADELQVLEKSGVAMVFCPGTHLYFDRPPTQYLQAGIPLPALGCDSRASNAALDPLREVALALKMMPEPGAQAWWGALTQRGAKAVQRIDLGCLDVGDQARVLRLTETPLEVQESAAALCDYLCSGVAIAREVCSFPSC